jgi:hypothetical protein
LQQLIDIPRHPVRFIPREQLRRCSLLWSQTTAHADCFDGTRWRGRRLAVSERERSARGEHYPRLKKEDMMPDQRNQQNQHGGKAGQQQGGGGQKPGQQQQQQPNQKQKPGQAGRKQEELDKKWRDVADPGQEPGTGDPGT